MVGPRALENECIERGKIDETDSDDLGGVVVALSAEAALAAAFNCGGGTCRGSSVDGVITGSGVRDVISALNGNDHVDAGGEDLVEPAVAWTR